MLKQQLTYNNSTRIMEITAFPANYYLNTDNRLSVYLYRLTYFIDLSSGFYAHD